VPTTNNDVYGNPVNPNYAVPETAATGTQGAGVPYTGSQPGATPPTSTAGPAGPGNTNTQASVNYILQQMGITPTPTPTANP